MSDINPFRFLRNGILLSTRARNITVKHVRGIWHAVSALALCFGEATSGHRTLRVVNIAVPAAPCQHQAGGRGLVFLCTIRDWTCGLARPPHDDEPSNCRGRSPPLHCTELPG